MSGNKCDIEERAKEKGKAKGDKTESFPEAREDSDDKGALLIKYAQRSLFANLRRWSCYSFTADIDAATSH